MKFVVTSVLVVIGTLGTSAFAKQVCHEIPEPAVAYDSINTNFDGSVSVRNPRVLVDGEYHFVAEPASPYEAGFCAVLGKEPISHKGSERKAGKVAHLDLDGGLMYTYSAATSFILDLVHCR